LITGLAADATEEVGDPPASDGGEERFERADRGIILEVRHLLGHRDDGILHDILGFGFGKAGATGHAVEHFPVGIEEILPTLLVVPIPEPFQQAGAGRKILVRFAGHRATG
jgi:hypothetical protein